MDLDFLTLCIVLVLIVAVVLTVQIVNNLYDIVETDDDGAAIKTTPSTFGWGLIVGVWILCVVIIGLIIYFSNRSNDKATDEVVHDQPNRKNRLFGCLNDPGFPGKCHKFNNQEQCVYNVRDENCYKKNEVCQQICINKKNRKDKQAAKVEKRYIEKTTRPQRILNEQVDNKVNVL